MVVDGTVVIIENIVRHFSLSANAHKTPLEKIRDAVMEVLRPVFYARAIIITAYLPIFTLQSVEGRLVQADGVDGFVRTAGRAGVCDFARAGAGAAPIQQGCKEWHNPVMEFLTELVSACGEVGDRASAGLRWALGRRHFGGGVFDDERSDRIGIFAASG